MALTAWRARGLSPLLRFPPSPCSSGTLEARGLSSPRHPLPSRLHPSPGGAFSLPQVPSSWAQSLRAVLLQRCCSSTPGLRQSGAASRGCRGMARWDEILTLPVQNPTTLEFSAADITWSMVKGWKDSMDRLALIPFSRVNDFVRGESNNKECPTRFHVEARRRRPPTMNCKPKVDGILEYILYWCSFGPDDYRMGGAVRPSRSSCGKRKTPAGRPNTKRGCVCHFIVKRLIAEPSLALVIYNQNKHVDKKGSPCHGPMDKMAVGTKAMFAPYISDELLLEVMSLLYVGIPVETIMQRHTEMVERQGGPSNRDDLLTHRYVRRLERKIRRSVYELDDDDAVSINIFVENHQDYIFFFEDFTNKDTFVWAFRQIGSYSR